jgi:hypothetical protein
MPSIVKYTTMVVSMELYRNLTILLGTTIVAVSLELWGRAARTSVVATQARPCVPPPHVALPRRAERYEGELSHHAGVNCRITRE